MLRAKSSQLVLTVHRERLAGHATPANPAGALPPDDGSGPNANEGATPSSTQANLQLSFTPAERRLLRRLRTPLLVQRFLNALPYNKEPPPGGPTLRSFRGVARHGTVHCLEAAVTAAAILEQHGYPPLLLSFESIDELDHVLFVYRQDGLWGSVARSRDPGLHGRKPVFRTARDLALSYVEPYVDFTGRVTGYAVVDLQAARELRLAAVGTERVEGRAGATRPSAPVDPLLGQTNRPAAQVVLHLQAGTPGPQAQALPRERHVE